MTPAEEAERAVVGAALISPTAVDELTEHISPTDCYEPRNEHILEAAITIRARGERPDPVTVADELGKNLARAGGITYLHELASAVTTAASVTYHAQIVREAAQGRRARSALTTATQHLDEGAPLLDVVNVLNVNLDALATDDDQDVPHEQAVYEAIATLDSPPGMPTPWPSLTNVIAGWKPGVVYVVAARPAVGKTLVGVECVVDMARRGKRAVLFSLEMSKTELYLRMFSNIGSVNQGHIQHRTLRGDDDTHLAEAASKVAQLPITLDDRAHVTVAQMRAKVKALQRRDEIGLVVVDYLQLMSSGQRSESRQQEVSDFSRSLKLLAKELKVPVVVLSQLNRGSTQRADPLPQLTDLRESGAIEQDADVVILLHRDLTSPEASSDLRVLVAKNRHGAQSNLTLLFQGHYSRISEPRNSFDERQPA